MDRHLRSLAIMIEVTSRHTKCTHFNLDYSRMLPLRYNNDSDKEATFSQMKLDSIVFSQAAQAIVDSPSPNVKTAFQLISWRESHLLRRASLSQRWWGRHVAT